MENDTITNPVVALVAIWGGNRSAMARDLGHRHTTTIKGWEDSGRVPKWRRLEIEDGARAAGKDIPTGLLDACIDGEPSPSDAA